MSNSPDVTASPQTVSAAPAREQSANPVHQRWAALEDEFASPILEDYKAETPAEACLRPLLQALGWQGVTRHLFEAMPHFDSISDIEGLRAVLSRLNYQTQARKARRLQDISENQMPCLFIPDGKDQKNVQLIIAVNDDLTLQVFDGESAEFVSLARDGRHGRVYSIEPADQDEKYAEISKTGWLAYVVKRFRWLLVVMFAISFLINLFALAVPLFVMGVYDKAIGARAPDVLLIFVLGISLILVTDLSLKMIRARAQAFLGARLDAIIASSAFRQLLNMPLSMTETAPIGSQITRLRQMESIREAFTGPLANAVVDLPFSVLFLIVIALISGHLVWIPVTLLLAYAVLGAITIPMTKRHVSQTGESKTKKDNFVIEALTHQRTIRELSEETRWIDEYRQRSGRYATQNNRARFFNFAVQTVSQSFVTLSGVATLGVGTIMVLDGVMSPGALIAVMALVWRVLTPLQQAFLSLNRLGQTLQSFEQMNRLMRVKLERRPGALPSFYRKFDGAISLIQLSFRYPQRQEPALRGVQFNVKPGEVIAITGPSGAGKTTLLNVITGLYTAQAGAVFVDGLDIRQLEPGEWRHAIGYVPETSTLFYGTIAQNLRLGHPSATNEDIERAAREAGIDDYQDKLPDGLETRLTTTLLAQLPDGLKKRLILARAYVKDAPLYLFDNPGDSLDRAGDEAFLAKIKSLKGKASVILTTHRPSHMRAADRLIYMDSGQVLLEGKPEEVIAKMAEAA